MINEYNRTENDRGSGRIEVKLDIECCTCENWHHLIAQTKAEGGREAKAIGWKHKRAQGGWICPDCADKI